MAPADQLLENRREYEPDQADADDCQSEYASNDEVEGDELVEVGYRSVGPSDKERNEGTGAQPDDDG